MAERKKILKKTKVVSKVAGNKGTNVKQSVKQTVKVVIGDIKKAVKRRPAKKAAPGPTRLATGAYSGVGISDRVVIPPYSRADPSLYNKDALLALTNQIEKLEYKADNAQVNLAGYLGNQLQNRLTYRNDASLEGPEVVIQEEKQEGPKKKEQDIRMNKIFDLAENLISEKQKREVGYASTGKTVTGKAKIRSEREQIREQAIMSGNTFQQQQINKGNAGAKAQQKIQELKEEKFAPIRFLEEPMTETEVDIPEIVFVEKIKSKPSKMTTQKKALKEIKARLDK